MVRKYLATRLFLLIAISAFAACEHEQRSDHLSTQTEPQEDTSAVDTWAGDLLIDTVEAKKLGYSVRWATDLKLRPGSELTHVKLLNDLVVSVEVPSNVVTAVSAADGAVLWSRVIGQRTDRLFAPARDGQQVVVNTGTQLYALAAKSGEIESVSELETIVTNSPAVIDGYAIFGGLNHRVFAHSVSGGYTKWAYQLTERVFIEPVMSGPNVFVVDANGIYAMLSATSGTLQWKGRIFGRVVSQSVVSPAGVFVASEDNALYAMNRATGRDRWIYRTTEPLTGDLSLVSGMLFLPLPGQGVVALAERTGEELWRLPRQARPLGQLEESLILHDEHSVFRVAPKTGKVLDEAPVQLLKTVLAGSENLLILVSERGRLLRMDPSR